MRGALGLGSGIGIFLFVLVCSTLPCSAWSGGENGPGAADLLKRRVDATSYPNEDAVILYRGISVRVDVDGRVTRRVREVKRLLTDFAITHEGDLRVPYDTTRQDLDIHDCRTFMLDGAEVPAEPRAFNRVTPDRVASCPDRTGLQEMVVSFLGVERGSMVAIDYEIRDRIRWRSWLEGLEPLAATYPILQGEVDVQIPEDSPFSSALMGDSTGWAIRFTEGKASRNWSFGPVPARPIEGGIAPIERAPYLVFSTCPSWDELLTGVRERIRVSGSPDSAIQAWAAGPLVTGRPVLDDRDRFEKAAWLIRERTTAADDPMVDWFAPVRPSRRSFDSSCGNLLDRAALALAALRAQGIEARPTLRPAVRIVAHEVPALSLFDDVWLVNGTQTLSVRSGRSDPCPDPGWAEEILDRTDCDLQFRPLPRRQSASRLMIHLMEGDDGTVHGEASLTMGGVLCRNLESGDVKRVLSDLAGRCARGGTLAGYRLLALSCDTFAASFSFTGRAIGDSLGGDRCRITLPSGPAMPDGVFPAGASPSRTKRTGGMTLSTTVDEEVVLVLEPSSAARILIEPSSSRTAAGGASIESSFNKQGRSWVWRRRLVCPDRAVPPDQYPGFRGVWLRRIGSGGAADVLILDHSSERSGTDDRSR